MSAIEMRPTFQLETNLTRAEALECIRDNMCGASANPAFDGQFRDEHAMISVVESDRHFWSPWLHLDFQDASGKCMVFGRFSPHPSIWTGFMFAYLAICVILFFGIMLGVSQQLSGQSSWGYFLIPIGVVVAILLWIASKAGQRLAIEEMQAMKSRLESCLERD